MKKVIVNLNGCDDTTPIEIEVTDEQLEFLKLLAEKSLQVSTYGCMPTIEIEVL